MVVALTVGCSKDVTKPENTNTITKVAKKAIKLDRPENPENPADSIGIIHNQALAYVYQKLTVKKDFSKDLKKKYVVEYFENRYGGNLMKSIDERDEIYRRYDNVPILALTKELPCSDVLAQVVNSIIYAAYEMKVPDDYNTFKQKIITLEQQVLKGKIKISRTEADQLLHFTSIIRHSMWFWMEAVPKNENLNETNFLRGFFRGLLGGLADAHGALVSLFSYMSFRYVLEDAALDSAMMLLAFGY